MILDMAASVAVVDPEDKSGGLVREEREVAPGRVVCSVRNVGHHMFTETILSFQGHVPEGFLDYLVMVVSALHDLLRTP